MNKAATITRWKWDEGRTADCGSFRLKRGCDATRLVLRWHSTQHVTYLPGLAEQPQQGWQRSRGVFCFL